MEPLEAVHHATQALNHFQGCEKLEVTSDEGWDAFLDPDGHDSGSGVLQGIFRAWR